MIKVKFLHRVIRKLIESSVVNAETQNLNTWRNPTKDTEPSSRPVHVKDRELDLFQVTCIEAAAPGIELANVVETAKRNLLWKTLDGGPDIDLPSLF
jgi:hypothetical protein